VREQHALGFCSSCCGLVWRVIDAYMDRNKVVLDLSSPSTARKKFDALQAASRICADGSIFLVLLVCRLAKILPRVIGPAAIDVINRILGPFSSHMKPRKTVRVIAIAIYSDLDISIPMMTSGYCSNRSPITERAAPNTPRKDTRLRVIVEKFAQTLRGKIGLSHETLQSLIGQRPAAIHSHVRASLLSLRPGQIC